MLVKGARVVAYVPHQHFEKVKLQVVYRGINHSEKSSIPYLKNLKNHVQIFSSDLLLAVYISKGIVKLGSRVINSLYLHSLHIFNFFFRMILASVCGLLFQSTGYYASLFWFSVTTAFFIVSAILSLLYVSLDLRISRSILLAL